MLCCVAGVHSIEVEYVTSSTAINQEYPMNKDLKVIIFNDVQSVFFSRKYKRGEGVIVFNATFNQQYFRYIMASSLLVEETGIPGENHRSNATQWQFLLHNVVSSTSRHERDSYS